MVSNGRNMFYQNKKQETTTLVLPNGAGRGHDLNSERKTPGGGSLAVSHNSCEISPRRTLSNLQGLQLVDQSESHEVLTGCLSTGEDLLRNLNDVHRLLRNSRIKVNEAQRPTSTPPLSLPPGPDKSPLVGCSAMMWRLKRDTSLTEKFNARCVHYNCL
ncbi:hypothetical protein AAG570_006752 [Ranatra chinensis]|uniref:Uncharacterized protein n=1 Tax=Ranatra chinensis TaxID=642074 RepID=A0ABD0YUZ7_9HEMI